MSLKTVILTWLPDGTVKPEFDPAYVETNDTLVFRSDQGPVAVKLTNPELFSTTLFVDGDPPIKVIQAGEARYDCQLLGSDRKVNFKAAADPHQPGEGGGVVPGKGPPSGK